MALPKGSKCSESTKLKISLNHADITGSKHPYWKGGRVKARGYIMIYKPDHPYAYSTGYVREHRLVMEEFLGRYLLPEEISHHINGITDDNRIENLLLFASNSDHTKYHNSLRKLQLNSQ